MIKYISPDNTYAEQYDSGEMKNYYLNLKISRLGYPITLTPGEATLEEIGIHAKLRQQLSHSTIQKHLRYLRYMQNHPCPVDIEHPNLENFIRHLDYRIEVENASPYALHHELKAMKMLLRAYGITPWEIKLPPAPKSHRRILPFPDTVKRMINYQYVKNKDSYENKLYQYILTHAFLIGMRNPSEIINLTIDDIIFNSNGTAFITITETKKRESKRTILLPKELATDPRRKSLKNWIDKWRPKVENQYSGNILYLQPSGKPFTVRHLGRKLSMHGKKVWSHFKPYDTRHWCAIARLIETKIQTGTYEPLTVRNWLGHEKLETTMNYIRYAEQYYQQAPYSWIQRILKHHSRVEEYPLNPVKVVTLPAINPKKWGLSTTVSPYWESGPAEAYLTQQIEKQVKGYPNPLFKPLPLLFLISVEERKSCLLVYFYHSPYTSTDTKIEGIHLFLYHHSHSQHPIQSIPSILVGGQICENRYSMDQLFFYISNPSKLDPVELYTASIAIHPPYDLTSLPHQNNYNFFEENEKVYILEEKEVYSIGLWYILCIYIYSVYTAYISSFFMLYKLIGWGGVF